MRHFPGGGSGYGTYGLQQRNSNGRQGNQRFLKEIHIKDDSGNDSVSVTNDNYQQRENMGSKDSRRSAGRGDS